jgi:hypothetical protein
MVVRQQMSQHERSATQSLAPVWRAKPVPIDESLEDLEAVRQMIETGRAILEVVEYPWGVEFDVSEVRSQR